MSKVVLKNLVKSYDGKKNVIDNIDLEINDKEFIVLVGSSGCGKSTILRLISGLEEITSGDIIIDEKVVNNVHPKDRDIAFVFQSYALYPHMTVYDNIAFGLKMRKFSKADIDNKVKEVAKVLNLEDLLDRKPKQLSGGQRQRVGIAQALLGDPEILVLDEPTAGLDPEERIRFRGIISDLSQQKTVLLSTHIVSDLEAVANKVILLKKGSVLDVKRPFELLEQIEGQVWIVTVPTAEEPTLTKKYACSNVMHTDGKSVIRLLSESGPHSDAIPTAPNMEDMYLYYFGK